MTREEKKALRKAAQKLRYRGKTFYLHNQTIYTSNMEVFIENATNGFLDLYEYFEYFEQPKIR